jgi:hypothetical protein
MAKTPELVSVRSCHHCSSFSVRSFQPKNDILKPDPDTFRISHVKKIEPSPFLLFVNSVINVSRIPFRASSSDRALKR